jgi:hypothetical protein
MNFLFYILTLINILLFLFAIWGKGFRQSFGASTDFSNIMIAFLFVVILASLIVKFGVRHKVWATAVAALPVVILFIMYLFDKKTGSGI